MAGSTGSVKTGRYTVLGPMRVWRGDTELTPGPPEQRALLALLALRAPGPVSVHEAVDVIGEGGPPDSAVNGAHRHIGGLRRLLEPELAPRAVPQTHPDPHTSPEQHWIAFRYAQRPFGTSRWTRPGVRGLHVGA